MPFEKLLSSQSRLRPTMVITACALLAASLTAVAPDDAAASPDVPAVPSSIVAPNWGDHGKKAGGAPAPLTMLKVAPGGEVAWGAVLTGGEQAIDSGRLELSGLPEGVKVRSGGVPGNLDDNNVARLTTCESVETGTSCALDGRIDSGQTVTVGLVIEAPRDIGSGNYAVTMALTGAGDVAPVNGKLRVRKGTKSALMVQSSGQALPQVGESHGLNVNVFNLGGGFSGGERTRIRLQRVLATQVASGVRAAGQGWRCSYDAKSCEWSGRRVGVGERLPQLALRYQIPQGAHRGIKRNDGAHEVSWVLKSTGVGFATDHRAQRLLLMPPDKGAAKQLKGPPKRKPVLNMSTSVLGDQTLGGLSTYRLMVNNGGWVPAKHARIQIEVPRHARIVRFTSTPRARCSLSGLCVFKRAVKANEGMPPIEFKMRSYARSRKAAQDKVAAVVYWKDQGKRYQDRELIEDNWVGPMKVVARPASKFVHWGESGDSAQGGVTASVSGFGEGTYAYRWTQECSKGTRCSKVKWNGSPSGTLDTDLVTSNFTVPHSKKKETLRFALHVSSGGSKVVSRTKVKAKPLTFTIDPRLKKSQPKKPGELPPASNPSIYAGTNVKPVAKIRINDRGHTTVSPGEWVSLRLKSTPLVPDGRGRVEGVKWKINGEPADLFAQAKRKHRGKKIWFRVPRDAPHAMLIVATAKYPKGNYIRRSEMVRVEPNVETSFRGSAAGKGGLRASGSKLRSQASSGFCDLYNKAQSSGLPSVAFDGVVMTLGQIKLAGADCNAAGAAINFTGGGLLVNGVGVTAAAGAITADGLVIKSAVFDLPSDSGIAKELSSLTGSPDSGAGGTIISVPFNGGVLSDMSGTAVFIDFPYLPLQNGWTVTSSKLTFSYSAASGFGVAISASATGPDEGSVSLSGKINTEGVFSLSVKASNVWEFVAKDGSVATFSGDGSISRTLAGKVTYDITLSMDAKGGTFELYGGVSVSKASVTWNNIGLQANANLQLTMGNESGKPTIYNFTASGTINDIRDWSITIKSDLVIDMTNAKISGLTGEVKMVKNPKTQQGELAIDLSGDVGINAGEITNVQLTIDKTPIVHIGIFCSGSLPAGVKRPPGCTENPPTLQMRITIQGTLGFVFAPGTDPTNIPFNTTVNANILTGGFAVDIGNQSIPGFGPKELNATGTEVFYTDDPGLEKALEDNLCYTGLEGQQASAFAGLLTKFDLGKGWQGNGEAVFARSKGGPSSLAGYCFSASIDVAEANTLLPENIGTFNDQISLVFSTYKTIVTFNGRPWTVPANQLTLIGDFVLGDEIAKPLGGNLPAVGIQIAYATSGSVTFDVFYEPTDTYLVGSGKPDETYAKLTSLGGTFSYDSKDNFTFGPTVVVEVHYPASPAGTDARQRIESEEMLVKGQIIFNPALKKFTVKLDVTGETVPIKDAFGVSGLDLNTFEVAGTIGGNELEDKLSVGASIQTPVAGDRSTFLGSLFTDIGVQPDTNIAFAVGLSEVQPCYALNIGDPKGDKLAINWLGAIEAYHVEMLFAPAGCPIASDIGFKDLKGFLFDFQGLLIGEKVAISGAFYKNKVTDPNLPTKKKWGASGNLNISMDAFNLAGISVTEAEHPEDLAATCPKVTRNKNIKSPGPAMNIQFATGADPLNYATNLANRLKVAFTGSINVWGVVDVDTCGGFTVQLGDSKEFVEFNLYGSEKKDLLGVFEEDMAFEFDADLAIPIGGGSHVADLKVAATQGVNVLSIVAGRVTAEFNFEKDVVNAMYAEFEADVDLYVLYIGASVTFNYCNPTVGTTCDIIKKGPVSGTDGRLDIDVEGDLRYWLFGWRETKGSVLKTSIPMNFQKPDRPPPPPAKPAPPAVPPIDYWPEATWNYSPQMFTGINWDAATLAKAAGVPVEGLVNPAPKPAGQTPTAAVPYGVAATDPTLGTPTAKFTTAGVQLGENTDLGPQASGTNVVGTVTLPQTPTYAQVISGLSPRALGAMTDKQKECAGEKPQSVKVSVPKWAEGHPIDDSSAAIVVSEINWKMFLASVVEQQSINALVNAKGTSPEEIAAKYTCGYNNWDKFPSLQEWFETESKLGIRMNLGYPQPAPDDTSMFCLKEVTPGTPYAEACKKNIALLEGSWGTGWGASSPAKPTNTG